MACSNLVVKAERPVVFGQPALVDNEVRAPCSHCGMKMYFLKAAERDGKEIEGSGESKEGKSWEGDSLLVRCSHCLCEFRMVGIGGGEGSKRDEDKGTEGMGENEKVKRVEGRASF